ncbi:MAG: M20 family metallopeptidase [Moorella humiferrea]|uniref:Peptidase M20 domain-containing protein 2 n=1 Tax=Neomoorella humiferrea TaxID=676965 RepID=A0A2T0ARJ0_9FIRM|nr:M20 family metallopeptidase [Moorella humiferrea]MBE3571687.1 M20 family metallopeptidase [Moorella humiferrea]PRR72474.1 p-aminobenzoyl-glutamate hydrolase subunit B [Moorella humiferrea]
MHALKEKMAHTIEALKEQIIDVAEAIYDHPETGNQEYFAVELLAGILAARGFKITRPLCQLPTAFRAELEGGIGPRVALIAEYDALPGLGHACGHNLIAAASLGAALALAETIKELGGTVVLLGTPAEETCGAKVALVRQGVFNDLDAVMMFHPGDTNAVEVYSLALEALEFIFEGRAAHAAACPEEGINALEAVIQFFNNINSLRPYLQDGASIQGIIAEGGTSPNVIPERTVARFYVRARTRSALNKVVQRVENCAAAAALATGCRYWYHNYEPSYEPMVTNRALAAAWRENLKKLGVTDSGSPCYSRGSLDMGNVSQVVPAIHPYLSLNVGRLAPHTPQFARAVRGEAGRRLVILAATVLAWTAADVILDKKLLRQMKEEFAGAIHTQRFDA